MSLWASNEFLAIAEELKKAGFVPALVPGGRFARRFADIGVEEFLCLNDGHAVSLVSGRAVQRLDEDREHFFIVPGIEELTDAILRRGYEIRATEYHEQRRWRISLANEEGAVAIKSEDDNFEAALGKALLSVLRREEDVHQRPMYENCGQLVLGSSSPRRKDLLSGCGLTFVVDPAHVDESVLFGEEPETMVRRLAESKARAVARKYPEAWVLGADTTVAIENDILGKPESKAEAVQMLLRIQGRTHAVYGAFALIRESDGVLEVQSHATGVTMTPFSEADAAAYVETGEPMDKAGAYAAQGLGAGFIQKIDGSYTNVVGLELNAVLRCLLAHKAIRLRK